MHACPDTIVAFVEWLVRKSGWKVRDPEKPDQLAAGYRKANLHSLPPLHQSTAEDITRDYVRALEAREIPHLAGGLEIVSQPRGSGNAASRAERDRMARRRAVALRHAQRLAVRDSGRICCCASITRSAACIRSARSRKIFRQNFNRLPTRCGCSLRCTAQRNRRPIADTVNSLLEATRAHAGFALRPAGHQVLANVYRVGDLARSFELSGGISFRGFVEELETQAEKAESAEAPVLEEGAEGVRLMTVHSAKGLEFPVVILADMTANIAAGRSGSLCRRPRAAVRHAFAALRALGTARQRRSQERLRERAEGVRVAYVAATRARDLLVVPAVGDEELDGWLSPLNKAIYPPHGSLSQLHA